MYVMDLTYSYDCEILVTQKSFLGGEFQAKHFIRLDSTRRLRLRKRAEHVVMSKVPHYDPKNEVIETRLRDQIPEYGFEQFCDTETGLELNEENVEKILAEIAILVAQVVGLLEFVRDQDYTVKVRLSGPAAGVMTVRVALTQKLREKIPVIAAVQLIE
ncbi:NifU-like protein 3, chloroplastic [Tanacetum coccineum]